MFFKLCSRHSLNNLYPQQILGNVYICQFRFISLDVLLKWKQSYKDLHGQNKYFLKAFIYCNEEDYWQIVKTSDMSKIPRTIDHRNFNRRETLRKCVSLPFTVRSFFIIFYDTEAIIQYIPSFQFCPTSPLKYFS